MPQPKLSADDALTAQQVSDQFGVSRRTIRRKVATGELVPVRQLPGVTGAHLFDPADVARVFNRSAA